MFDNDWKDKLKAAFPSAASSEPVIEEVQQDMSPTIDNSKQKLIVSIDRRNRGGKQVTLIKGFVGRMDEFEELSKKVKKHCGVGGNYNEEEIMIQGDKRDVVVNYLLSLGYKAKRGN